MAYEILKLFLNNPRNWPTLARSAIECFDELRKAMSEFSPRPTDNFRTIERANLIQYLNVELTRHFQARRWKEAFTGIDAVRKLFVSHFCFYRVLSELSLNEKSILAMTHSVAGQAHYNDHNIEEAIRQWEESLVYRPDNSEVKFLLARAQVLQDNRDAAIKYFREAKEGSDSNRIPLIECYIAFLQNSPSSLTKAVQICDGVIIADDENNPVKLSYQDETLYMMDGLALFIRNDYADSAMRFQHAIELIDLKTNNTGTHFFETNILFICYSIALVCHYITDPRIPNPTKIILKETLQNVSQLIKLYVDKSKQNATGHTLTYLNPHLRHYGSFAGNILFAAFNTELQKFLRSNVRSRGDSQDIDGNLVKVYMGLFHKYMNKDPYDPLRLMLHLGLQPHLETLMLHYGLEHPLGLEQHSDSVIAYLAYCYLHGYRVKQNTKEAARLLKNNPSPLGKAEYGYMLWRGMCEEVAVKPEILFTEATSHSLQYSFHKEENLRAKTYLALMHLELNRDRPQAHTQQALEKLEESAQEGCIFAQAELCNIYAIGRFGINQNKAAAMAWLKTLKAHQVTLPSNMPDYFHFVLLISQLYREKNCVYDTDLLQECNTLLEISKMGSIKAKVRLGNIYWEHFSKNKQFPNQQANDSTTFHYFEPPQKFSQLRNYAVHLWREAEILGYGATQSSVDYLSYANLRGFAAYSGQDDAPPNRLRAVELFESCLRLVPRFSQVIERNQIYEIYYRLGLLYAYSHLHGVRPDNNRAKQCFEKACDSTNGHLVSNVTKHARLRLSIWNHPDRVSRINFESYPSPASLRAKHGLAINGQGYIMRIYQEDNLLRIMVGKMDNAREIRWLDEKQDTFNKGKYVGISVNDNNYFVCCMANDNDDHFYSHGKIENDKIVILGDKKHNDWGHEPVIALAPNGRVVEVHKDHNERARYSLYYRLGNIGYRSTKLEFSSSYGSQLRKESFYGHSIAINDTHCLLVWQSAFMYYQIGKFDNQGILWQPEIVFKTGGDSDKLTDPSVHIDKDGHVVIACSTNPGRKGFDDLLYFISGQLNAISNEIEWHTNDFQPLAQGSAPVIAVYDKYIIGYSINSDGKNLESSLNRFDIPLEMLEHEQARIGFAP